MEKISDAINEDYSAAFKPLIVLHDKKSRVWNPPMMYQSEDAAKRDLAQAAKHGRDVSTGRAPLFVDFPDDFQLMVVGYYNTFSGEVISTNSGYPQLLSEVAAIIVKE